MKNKKDLNKAIKKALLYDESVLIEKYIAGREITCGVIEKFNGQDIYPLAPTEILLKKLFFSL